MKLIALMRLNDFKTMRYRRTTWVPGMFIWFVQESNIFTDQNGKILETEWLLNESQNIDWTEHHEEFIH